MPKTKPTRKPKRQATTYEFRHEPDIARQVEVIEELLGLRRDKEDKDKRERI